MTAHRPNKLTNKQVEWIHQNLGKVPQRAMATRFGVSQNAISYQATKIKPRFRYKPQKRKVDDAEVLRLYGLTMSPTAVARELGVTPDTIHRTLKRLEA